MAEMMMVVLGERMKLVHLSLTDKGAADAHRLRPALTLEEGDGAHEGARCFIPLLAHFIPCRDDTLRHRDLDDEAVRVPSTHPPPTPPSTNRIAAGASVPSPPVCVEGASKE